MCSQVRQLRPELLYLLVQRPEFCVRGIRRVARRLCTLVLIDQALIIDPLLLGSVQSILLILQLALQTCENLNIALLLTRQSTFVYGFKLLHLRFLRS